MMSKEAKTKALKGMFTQSEYELLMSQLPEGMSINDFVRQRMLGVDGNSEQVRNSSGISTRLDNPDDGLAWLELPYVCRNEWKSKYREWNEQASKVNKLTEQLAQLLDVVKMLDAKVNNSDMAISEATLKELEKRKKELDS